MDRITEAQDALTLIYTAYNKIASNPLAPLDVNDAVGLKKLLDTVMNRESVAHIQNKKAQKESTELRSSLADVLLLLDGCDMKEIKEKMKKSTAAAAAVAEEG